MEVRLLPPDLSKLIGGYDKNLKNRYEAGLAGNAEVMCYDRFYDDIERSKSKFFPYYLDQKECERVLKFSSLLVVYDEQGTRHRLELYGIQDFILVNIFGWKNKESNTARYRESYIQLGRRNGKSWINSVMLHYFLTASKYRSERAIIISVKKESAKIVFNQFAQFVDADPDLAELYNISKANGYASSKGTDNYVTVFSGAKDADGYQSIFCCADEAGLQDGELWQLIADGQANLANAHMCSITTASFTIGGWCHNKYKGFREQLRTKTLDDRVFVLICEPDPDDDVSDYRCWAKANPVLFFDQQGNLRQDRVDTYTSKYNAAARAGGKQMTSWKTKQCNIWCVAQDALLCDFDKLHESKVDFSFQDVMNLYKNWYLGIDLAQVLDLNSICWATWIYVDKKNHLLPPDKKRDGIQKLYLNWTNYIPAATLSRHIQTDRFDYAAYLEKEIWLTVNGGGQRTDYSEILGHIKKIKEDNEIHFKTIACDPYGCSSIQQGLADICDCLIMQSQSHKALAPYVEQFGGLVAADEICISKGSCDIFIKAVTNSVVSFDNQGYCFISKPTIDNNTNYRIDPCDAMLDAIIAPLIDRDTEDYTIEDAINDWAELYR